MPIELVEVTVDGKDSYTKRMWINPAMVTHVGGDSRGRTTIHLLDGTCVGAKDSRPEVIYDLTGGYDEREDSE